MSADDEGTDSPFDSYVRLLDDMEKYRNTLRPRDYEWRSELLDEYFNTNCDPGVLHRALIYTWASTEHLPSWLVHEIGKVLEAQRDKADGPGKHTFVSAEKRFHEDMQRGWAVWERLRQGTPVREVYQAAADDLANTKYQGSDEAMRKSWKRIKAYFPPLR